MAEQIDFFTDVFGDGTDVIPESEFPDTDNNEQIAEFPDSDTVFTPSTLGDATDSSTQMEHSSTSVPDTSDAVDFPIDSNGTDKPIDAPVNPDAEVSPAPTGIPDTEQPEELEAPASEYTINDIYALLDTMNKRQEETETAFLQNQMFLVEQSKNILSTLVVIAFILAFSCGILFARVVWRKM